jgi:ribosomal protein S18 acetylase RimI-like enzyme/ketosteroid isomerase-like protein
MGPEEARLFAQLWAAAWNRHDIDAVLAHFDDNIVFTSPVAARLSPEGNGTVRGKAALRAYWQNALSRHLDLHFEVLSVYIGVDTLVINFCNQAGGVANEVLRFAQGRVVEGHGTYLAPADRNGARPPQAANPVPYEVRRIRLGEGDRLRALRLQALSEAPGAFSSTYASDSARPADFWAEAARAHSHGYGSATFVADAGGEWVGLCGGARSEGPGRTVQLVSMWVAPACRQSGLGRRLVEEALNWAQQGGAAEVELWVTRGNEAAISLYRKMGFETTGNYQSLPSDPCRHEQRMVLRFGGGA